MTKEYMDATMNLCIISGSHRKNSESSRIASYIAEQDFINNAYQQINLLDLNTLNLPLWNEGVWENSQEWEIWQAPSACLKASDAFIFIVPEWAGMVPPGLKNLLLLAGPEELGHKPALIVTISSGQGGSIPVHELRTTGYKNNHICFIPDHVILRNINNLFSETINESNHYFHQRLKYSTDLLTAYAEALKPIRNSGIIDNDNYRYGMS